MRTASTVALAAAALALLTAPQALAQPGTDNPTIKGSADPRDLNGVWFLNNPSHLDRDRTVHYGKNGPMTLADSRVLWPIDGSIPPFTDWGLKRFNARYDGNIANKPIADPSTSCIPHGVPRAMVPTYPFQIVQTKGITAVLYEVAHDVQMIYMDRPLPKKPKITQMGTSVGHWEGDELVVQTVGLDDSAIIDQMGTPHSNQLKLTERFKKTDGGRHLEVTMTFDDPVAYKAPWTARTTFNLRTDMKLMEYVCEENNRNAVDANGVTGAK